MSESPVVHYARIRKGSVVYCPCGYEEQVTGVLAAWSLAEQHDEEALRKTCGE